MELQIVLETILNELCRLIGIVPLKAVNRVLCAVDPTNFVCGAQAYKANQHSTAELSTFQKCLLGNLLVVDSLLRSVFVHNYTPSKNIKRKAYVSISLPPFRLVSHLFDGVTDCS